MRRKRASALLFATVLVINTIMPVCAAEKQEESIQMTEKTVEEQINEEPKKDIQSCETVTEEQKTEALNEVTEDGFQYNELDDGTIEIYNYYGTEEYLTIPSKIDGKEVTSIAGLSNGPFSINSTLLNVTLPESVTNVNGGSAFATCKNLVNIYVDSNNNYYSSQDGILYNKEQTVLIRYPQGKQSGCTISDKTISIGNEAFSGCEKLTNVTIPDSVTVIGKSVFEDCSSLDNVVIPNSVTSIGNNTFKGCYSLTNVKLSDKMESISDWMFDGCTNLINIEIPANVTKIGVSAFARCSSLTSIMIPAKVEYIGKYLSEGGYMDYDTTLIKGVFEGCTNLLNINVDAENVNFSSKEGVLFDKEQKILFVYPEGKSSEYIIPDGVTSIDGSAFANCVGLVSLTIPKSVVEIPVNRYYGVFDGCTNLVNIEVDSENKSYSSLDGVLFNKDREELIYYPKGKKGSYTVPLSVVKLGANSFADCEGLTSVIISDSVKNICFCTFYKCLELNEIYFCGDAPTMEWGCLYDVVASVYYPEGNGTWTDEVKENDEYDIYYEDGAIGGGSGELTWKTWIPSESGETEHTWNAGKVTKEPTCTETGERTYTCTGCGETKTEEIKATGHSYGEWTIVKEATTSEEGCKERVCQKCGNKETQSIPKLPCSEWKQNSKGWWYENPDGTYPTSCWMEIDGSWYYFNASGYRVTGWQKIKNTWYYFDPATGIMYEEHWLELDGKSYYLKSGGAMATGWLELEEGWYYLNSSGVKVTGWIKSGSKWYYLDKQTGIMQAGKWIDDTYYLQTNGAMATGWLELEEGWYYLNSSGVKVTGWQKISNVWYYFDPATGIMYESEWLDDTYYLKSSGAMATGWQLIGEDYYYFDTSGKKVTGKWVGNYYLKSDGVMARSEWVDNDRYYVDENGKWVPGKRK